VRAPCAGLAPQQTESSQLFRRSDAQSRNRYYHSRQSSDALASDANHQYNHPFRYEVWRPSLRPSSRQGDTQLRPLGKYAKGSLQAVPRYPQAVPRYPPGPPGPTPRFVSLPGFSPPRPPPPCARIGCRCTISAGGQGVKVWRTHVRTRCGVALDYASQVPLHAAAIRLIYPRTHEPPPRRAPGVRFNGPRPPWPLLRRAVPLPKLDNTQDCKGKFRRSIMAPESGESCELFWHS